MLFQSTLAAVFFCLVSVLPLCTAEPDYTIQMFESENFGGETVVWHGNFGQCGSQSSGFYVGSVVLPVGGVDCLIYTNHDSLCMEKPAYNLKYTESDINPSTTDGTTYSNTWYSWKCWPCEICGNSVVHTGSESEPSKNNSLAYGPVSKTENDDDKHLDTPEHTETVANVAHEEDHVDMSKRQSPDTPIEADDPTQLNGAIMRELLANDAPSKTHNETIEASDEVTAHLVRASVPRFHLPKLHLSNSHKSSPKPKSKDKKCNNITGDCSDAASLVPMRKLLGVAVGAGVVAGTGF